MNMFPFLNRHQQREEKPDPFAIYNQRARDFQRGAFSPLEHIPPEELEIIETIGSGGNGTVYCAYWTKEKQRMKVAVKEVTNHELSSEELAKEADVQRLGEFSKVYGIALMDDHTIWIVSEYYEQGDLRKFLDTYGGPLPLETQVKFCTIAAGAVRKLHEKRVIHRDIKAYNFLVYIDSLYLTDFGMANSTRNVGKTIGTVAWTAPEVLRQESKWTKKSDVFSLGMLFYEIVSRQLPFENKSEEAISELITSGKRPDIPDECPKEIRDIIQSCWADNPAARPSAALVSAKLNRIAESFGGFPNNKRTEARIRKHFSQSVENGEYTWLMAAAVFNAPDQIRQHLFMGDPIEATSQSQTALSYAVSLGHSAVVKELLECGANIHHLTNGDSLLVVALFSGCSGSVETVDMLLQHGLSMDVKKDGLSPLMIATGKDLELIEVLVKHGAKIEGVDDEGRTALMLAAKLGRVHHVKKLIELGANVNAKTQFRDTALMFAAERGSPDVVQTLIEHGADVDAMNGFDIGCLGYAAQTGETEVVEILLKHMTPTNVAFECGMFWAKRRENGEALKLIKKRYDALIESGVLQPSEDAEDDDEGGSGGGGCAQS